MNLNNTTNKSTQELKNQVLEDIKKVREDFNEIKNRLTPGQIIDDALFYRSSSANPTQTFNKLKNNPIGTSFLTLGTLLLMEDSHNRTYEGIAREKVGDAVSNAKEKIDHAKETIQSKFPHKESSDVDFSAAFGSDVSNKVEGLKSTARETIDSAKEKTREGFETAKSRVEDAYQSASSTVRNLDPLTYLVLGAGLGAISGVAIPVTDTEESFVDEKLQPRLMEFRLDLESALNESANILKNEFIGGMTNINFNLF